MVAWAYGVDVDVTVKVDPTTANYTLIGPDGDSRSEGTLLDAAALAIDILAMLGIDT